MVAGSPRRVGAGCAWLTTVNGRRASRARAALGAAAFLALASCVGVLGPASAEGDAAVTPGDGGSPGDAGAGDDAGAAADAGTSPDDAGTPPDDAGTPPDAGVPPHDAGAPLDSGTPSDAGPAPPDAGPGPPTDAGAPSDAGLIWYTTTFTRGETPLSEGGVWSHHGLDWTVVTTSPGRAHGTQTGNGGYDDSYAYLAGLPPDQSASAVIFLDPAATGPNREVEVLLRWSDSAHSATGYECNLHYQGFYAEIVRWNGALSDFTPLARAATPPTPKTGDVLKATVVGDFIRVSLNGVEFMQVHDATYASGGVGVGFYIDPGASNADYGFSSFTAAPP
jgi:hypothetical protein